MKHIGLVEPIVQHLTKHRRRRLELDDLRQAGFLGLIEASRKFEPDRGIKFATFASYRIRGAVLDELGLRAPTTRAISRRARAIARTRNKLEQLAGRAIKLRELAESLGTSVLELSRLMDCAASTKVFGIDSLESEGSYLSEVVGTAPSPSDEVDTLDSGNRLAMAMRKLDSRENTVISMRYYQGASQSEVGRLLNISASRVCQIESRALKALRAELGARFADPSNGLSIMQRQNHKNRAGKCSTTSLELSFGIPMKKDQLMPTTATGPRYLLEAFSEGRSGIASTRRRHRARSATLQLHRELHSADCGSSGRRGNDRHSE